MSYLAWNALNTGETGSDFQTIARDTNFTFNTHKGRVNWSQIDKLSIDRLIDEQNVALLGHNINNVVNFDIESEFDVRILNSNFVKIFKLSQLTNDFLLHCKRHLNQQKFLLKADLGKVSRKLTSVRKENVELKKIIHWNKWKPAGTADSDAPDCTAMCGICGKVFQFESFLIMHYNRRHPGVNISIHKPDNDKEPGECSVSEVSHASISNAGGGVAGGSRDHRYATELESLRNLITTKLGRSYKAEVPGGEIDETNKLIISPRLDEALRANVERGKKIGEENREMAREVLRKEANTQDQEKISKEEYEKHLKTMENSWRKQFEDLDKKYQHEIVKLQEKLKTTMEENKLTCEKLISEKENSGKGKREVMKQVNFGTEYIQHRYKDDDTFALDEGATLRINDIENKESEKIIVNTKENVDEEKTSTDRESKASQNIFSDRISDEQEKSYPDGSDKLSRRNMMREEINKLTVDKINREEEKSKVFHQSLTPKRKDAFLDIVKNIKGELNRTKSITRQKSFHDFSESSNQLLAHGTEQNNTGEQANWRSKCENDQYDNKNNAEDIVFAPINFKKDERGNTNRQKEIDEGLDNTSIYSHETLTKTAPRTNESKDPRITNYEKFLEFLNQNDEFTKIQIGGAVLDATEKHKKEETKKSFFKDTDPHLFDFSREITTNGLFFSEDFKRSIAKISRLDSNISNTADIFDTFKVNDKPLSENRERIERTSTDENDKIDDLSNRQNRLSHLESLLAKIDGKEERGLKATDILDPKTSFNKDDLSNRTSHTNQSKVRGASSTVHQLKHSSKCFGDISKATSIEQNCLKPLATPHSELYDEVIRITNPDNDFDYTKRGFEASSSESSKSDTQDTPTESPRDEAFAEYKGGSQITVTRAEYEILAKDLSIIVEETDTDESMPQSPVVDGKMGGATPINTSAKLAKALPGSQEADVPLQVTHKSENDKLQDKRKSRSTRCENLDEESSDDTIKANTSNTTTVTIHEKPVTESQKSNPNIRTNESPSDIANARERLPSTKPNKEETSTPKDDMVKKSQEKEAETDEEIEIIKKPETHKSDGMYAGLEEHEEETRENEDAIDNEQTKLTVKSKIMDMVDEEMKRFHLNPEWTRLPDISFEQKMQMVEQERSVKRKNIKNYDDIKATVKRTLESFLKNNLATGKKSGESPRSSDKKLDERKSNEETDKNNSISQSIRSESMRETSKTQVLARDSTEEGETSRNKLKKDNIILVNQKLIDVLSKDLLKAKSEESDSGNMNKEILRKEKPLISKTPGSSFDFVTSHLNYGASYKTNTSVWETMNTSEPEAVIQEMDYTSTHSLVAHSKKEDTSKNKTVSDGNSLAQRTKVSAPKQAFESRLTKNMYNEDGADILDREPEYLQTNNFTSKQPIIKTKSGGYKFFGKSKKTSTAESKSPKSSEIDGTIRTNSRNDTVSPPSSWKESSQGTLTPRSSRENDKGKPNGFNKDLFLVKTPQNISTSSTSESHFQVRKSRAKPKLKDQKGNQSEVIVNTVRLDCGDVSASADTNETNVNNKDLAEDSPSLEIVYRLSSLKPQETTKAYVVPNERSVNEIKTLTAVEDGAPFAGTIRSIAKQIQDSGDSDSSFDMDEYLEKNNMG